jgi:glycerol kinase
VQWLRDGLKIVASSADTDALAARSDPAEQVYLVPAFVGLGAPYWDAQARAAIFGLTRNCGAAEFARAALESVGYQTRDLVEAMRADWPDASGTVLRVDGGMTASDAAMQFIADILDAPVDRPKVMETTALGAAYLAGLASGLCPGFEGFAATWQRDRRFEPRMDHETRDRKWQGWRDAVSRTLTRR